MTRALAALALVLLSAPAAAQEPARDPGSTTDLRRSRAALAVGLDYRYVWNYYYFYASPSGAYSETESTLPAVALEAAWQFPVGQRLSLAPGFGLSLGAGNADFWSSGGTLEGDSYSATTYHVELFGEIGLAVSPRFTLLGRLGYGATGVGFDAAADGATNALLAAGVRYDTSPRLGFAALYQGAWGLDGWTDAGITSADPSLEDYESWALQLRVIFRP